MPTNDGILKALAAVESQLRSAVAMRESIQRTAGEMQDDWNAKAQNPHDPDLRHHLLERRLAMLMAAQKGSSGDGTANDTSGDEDRSASGHPHADGNDEKTQRVAAAGYGQIDGDGKGVA